MERSSCWGRPSRAHGDRGAQLAAAGHELGNHLWSHRDPAELDAEDDADGARQDRRGDPGAAAVDPAPRAAAVLRRAAAGCAGSRADGSRARRPADRRSRRLARDLRGRRRRRVLAGAGPGRHRLPARRGRALEHGARTTREVTVAAVALLVPATARAGAPARDGVRAARGEAARLADHAGLAAASGLAPGGGGERPRRAGRRSSSSSSTTAARSPSKPASGRGGRAAQGAQSGPRRTVRRPERRDCGQRAGATCGSSTATT